MTVSGPPTAVPCPEWCDQPAWHPYDQLAGNPAIDEGGATATSSATRT